jgi:Zn-dependent protease
MPDALYLASTWVIFVILAITLHEAAHAFVARFLGYDTASKLGRVNLNPFKHIDPVATILLPGLLLLARSLFLFGYAKPVPAKFAALRDSRRDLAWVAAAGPAMNITLATCAWISLDGLFAGEQRTLLARGLIFALDRVRQLETIEATYRTSDPRWLPWT